ncbi:MAG: hypothetical protein R3F61_16335 [Myxococcota bacterium]
MILACLTSFAAAPPVPWAADWEGEGARIAIVGALPDDDHGLAEAVLARDPDLVVLTGVSATADLSAWRLGAEHRVVARSVGAPRKAWLKRFDGIGVSGIDKPVPYGAVDAVIGGTRWRILYLTTWTTPARTWEEQSYWLPKALDRSSYDRLLVVTDAPAHTLAEAASPARGADILLDRVQERADPLSFVAMIAGNTDTNELFAPGGRFGEVHLVAGSSDGGGAAFARAGGGGLTRRRELEPAFVGALEEQGFGPETYTGVSGFWTLELDRGNAVLDFWMEREARWEVVYRLVRDKQGWHLP